MKTLLLTLGLLAAFTARAESVLNVPPTTTISVAGQTLDIGIYTQPSTALVFGYGNGTPTVTITSKGVVTHTGTLDDATKAFWDAVHYRFENDLAKAKAENAELRAKLAAAENKLAESKPKP